MGACSRVREGTLDGTTSILSRRARYAQTGEPFPILRAEEFSNSAVPKTGNVPSAALYRQAWAAGIPRWALREALRRGRAEKRFLLTRHGFGKGAYSAWARTPPTPHDDWYANLLERAQQFLGWAIPRHGSIPVSTLYARASDAGISAWALNEVRRTSGVIRVLRRGIKRRFFWSVSRRRIRKVSFWSEWAWTPGAWGPEAPRLCAWKEGCQRSPRSNAAAYCDKHQAEARRRSKRAWKVRDRARFRRWARHRGTDTNRETRAKGGTCTGQDAVVTVAPSPPYAPPPSGPTPAEQASEVLRLLRVLQGMLPQHLSGRIQDPLTRARLATEELVRGLRGE